MSCLRVIAIETGEGAGDIKFWYLVVILSLASVLCSVVVYMGFRLRHQYD